MNSDFLIYTSIGLGLYFLSLVLLTLHARYVDKGYGYVIGHREVGILPTMASIIAGLREGGGLMIWISMGAGLAFGSLWLALGILAGFSLLYLCAGWGRRLAGEENFITLHDLFKYCIGVRTAAISSIIIMLAALGQMAGQLYIVGYVLSEIFNIPAFYGTAATALIVGVYMLVGGYITIVRTDVVQWALITLTIVWPLYLFPVPTLPEISQQMLSVDWLTGLGFFLYATFLILCLPDAWQRLFSTRSPNVAKAGVALAAPFFMVIIPGLIVLGTYLHKAMPDVAPNLLFYAAFTGGVLPPLFLAGLMVLLFSSAMSTLDSQTYVFTSTLARNILKIEEEEDTNFKAYRRIVQWGTVAILATLTCLTLVIGDAMKFIFDSYGFLTLLAPVILLTRLRGTDMHIMNHGTAFALSIGLLLYTFMFVTEMFPTLGHNLIPAGVVTLMLLADWWRIRK